MNYIEYKEKARETATYPKEQAVTYLNLGLRGESGEVCDKIKKLIRDERWTPGDAIPEDWRRGIALELGDVLWYCANKSFETKEPMNKLYSSENAEDEELHVFSTKQSTARLPSAAIELFDAVGDVSSSIDWIVFCIEDVAMCLGYGMDEIAQMNIDKLRSRQMRGMLGGSGDYR